MVEGLSRVVPLVALVTLSALAGCLGSGSEDKTVDEVEQASGYVPVAARHTLAFNTTDKWSHTLQAGPYAILDALEIDVAVDVPTGKGVLASVNIGVVQPEEMRLEEIFLRLTEESQAPRGDPTYRKAEAAR